MPCWYFEKKEIKSTPSFQDGIDGNTEHRYRREGARFIIDAGTKMGLRYDTCATGVTYFHRFYMFHSFKEFHRYVTGACCLFLAGKVEETPKKCKDIIKTCQSLLTQQQFAVFGSDPREEVMTLERILLQTIKFDLQVEHPYGLLLKYAKLIKGDKEKIQKLVQMAWTFVNDSLCTALCLQWEPEIIAVSLMYLATRLTKFDVQDWEGKKSNSKSKWWEYIAEDVTVELMEDICHQCLDLYSSKSAKREESPPPPPNQRTNQRATLPVSNPLGKRGTPHENVTPGHQVKMARSESGLLASQESGGGSQSTSRPGSGSSVDSSKRGSQPPPVISEPVTLTSASSVPQVPTVRMSQSGYEAAYDNHQHDNAPAGYSDRNGYSQYNPYVSSQMYSSSFLSQEGSRNIQSLICGNGNSGQYPATYPPSAPGTNTQYPQYTSANYQPNVYPQTVAPGPPSTVPPAAPYQGSSTYHGSYPPAPPQQNYPPSATQPYTAPPTQQSSFQGTVYPPAHQQYGAQPYGSQGYQQHTNYQQQNRTYPPKPGFSAPGSTGAPRGPPKPPGPHAPPKPAPSASALTQVRITGR